MNRDVTYVGAFLTLSCNYKCTYCINHAIGKADPRKMIGADIWIKALNSLQMGRDLPISLQGGEPSLHPQFFEILKGIRKELSIDILTNLTFNLDKFCEAVSPERMNREAPYAPIRVSYHPREVDLEELLKRVLYLQKRKYRIGLYAVETPANLEMIERARRRSHELGIDFRTKKHLSVNRDNATAAQALYKYPSAVIGQRQRSCLCRTSEILIAPNGELFRCHRDLYLNENPTGSIGGGEIPFTFEYRPCDQFGTCNPCDIKVKTDRFQNPGYTAVNIQFDD